MHMSSHTECTVFVFVMHSAVSHITHVWSAEIPFVPEACVGGVPNARQAGFGHTVGLASNDGPQSRNGHEPCTIPHGTHATCKGCLDIAALLCSFAVQYIDLHALVPQHKLVECC